LLNPIGASPVKFRTSLYADDAVLFLQPTQSDVAHLEELLQSFGCATGMCTNILKTEIIPIRCDHIDVPAVLGNFHAQIADLPTKYLGLPLRIGRLRRNDEQVQIDKVAAKLPRWEGKVLNKAGCLELVNSVLSSTVLYHMTVFQLSKWAIKKIDKIR
jgi:hypothetical protein